MRTAPLSHTVSTKGERYRLLIDALNSISCAPIHGRRQSYPAPTTSRTPNTPGDGTTEVDYIIMSTKRGVRTGTPLRPKSWSAIPTGISHRAVLMRFTLSPGVRSSVPACRPARFPPVPNYDDARHRDMAVAFAEEVHNAQLDDGAFTATLTASEMLSALRECVTTAAARSYSMLPTTGIQQPTDTAPSQKCVTGLFKTCKGERVPPYLVQLLHERTLLHRELIKTRQRHGRGSDIAVDLLQRVREREYEIRRVQRRFLANLARKRGLLSEHLRCKNAHEWIRLIKRVSALHSTLACSEEGFKPDNPATGVSAKDSFNVHFRQQLGTARPMPEGMTDKRWHDFIPHAAASNLWSAAITWQEVYLLLYPTHPGVLPDTVCPGVGANCVLCKQYTDKVQAWANRPGGANPDDTSGDMPHYTPHLHTSVCAGPDGIKAEMLAWARAADSDDTMQFRQSVCELLAQLYEKIRTDGRMPDGSTMNRTIALLKVAKPGAPAMDATDPNDYRGITMGDTISKLFGLVICKRMMHWVVAHNIISPEQVGFMQGKGCEDHVFSLLETVRSQWRANQPAYVLFVDIAKAYDSVNPEALWFVLKKMGIPGNLVDLLADWSSKRQTQVHVNGESGEPFNMLLGLGQGDILSPLLYNLFTEPLTRFILEHARLSDVTGYSGIRVSGVRVTELKYADDSALVSDTARGLQTIADAFVRWCKAWGLAVSLGNNKSEAMAMYPPKSDGRAHQCTDAPPALPPIVTPAGIIRWVKQYKYLGLLITHDLDFSHTINAMTQKLQGVWQRYFVLSSHVRGSSPAMTLQLYRTLVLACCNYLCCLLEPDSKLCKAVDRLSMQVARLALRAPPNTPTYILWAESRLLPMAALMYRERYRLMHKYSQAWKEPHRQQDIAVRLFHVALIAIRNGQAKSPFYNKQCCSWVSRAFALNAYYDMKLQADGVTVLVPSSGNMVSQYASRMARSAAMLLWRQSRDNNLASSNTSASKLWQNQVHLGQDPACTSPTMTAASLYGLAPDPTDTSQFPKVCTPVSVFGPGCSAGILALDVEQRPRRRLAIIMAMRLGTAGLWTEEFGEDAKQGKRWISGDGYRDRHINILCDRCRQGTQSPLHVALICSHQAVAGTRKHVLSAAEIERILNGLVKELLRPEYEHGLTLEEREQKRNQLQARRLALAGYIESFTLTLATAAPSRAHRFLLYRLLAVTPWTAANAEAHRQYDTPAATADWQAACALGQLFDDTQRKPNMLRTLARTWISWASSAMLKLAYAWKHRQQQMVTPPPSVSTASDTDASDLRNVPLPHSSNTRQLATGADDMDSDISDYAAGHSEDDSTIDSADEDSFAAWDSDDSYVIQVP